MTSGSLFLHPSDGGADCSVRHLSELLRCVGLAGEALPGKRHAFLVGPRFLDLVSFMGCSPYVELEPPSDGGTAFCHMVIHHRASPRLVFSYNTRPPRCPQCRKPFSQSAQEIATLAENDIHSVLRCPHCHTETPLTGLRWRQDGGLGRLFVEIRNIFPGEAIPVDSLLLRLENDCGGTWDYFYLRADNAGQ